MSLLNLPEYPSINQIASSGGIIYQWTGSKWKRLDTSSTSNFIEYKDIGTYSGNTVVLDTEKYNYHNINVPDSYNLTIDIPPTTQYDTFRIAVDFAFTSTWDISVASYTNKSFSVTTQDTSPLGVFFKPDGTTMYVIGAANDRIQQYTLSTPWDIATASYANKFFSVTTQETTPRKVFFKPDGISMYIIGNNTIVYQYILSTPWDIATASYASKSFSTVAQGSTGDATSIFFKNDGTIMYMASSFADSVFQYTLSTPWDIATASYASKSFNMATQDNNMYDIFFKPDGTTMYAFGLSNDIIYQYTLSTPWEITTASYTNKSFSVTTQDSQPVGLFFNPSGTKIYTVGLTNGRIYQYALSNPGSITWPENVNWIGGTAPEIADIVCTYIFELTAVSDNKFVAKMILRSEE